MGDEYMLEQQLFFPFENWPSLQILASCKASVITAKLVEWWQSLDIRDSSL